MAGKTVAVDLGSHTIKVLALRQGKTGLAVTAFSAFPAKQKAQGLLAAGLPLKGAVTGLSGRDMTLRYTQVPPSPDWQLRNLMDLEIQDLSSQSGDELSADYNLLPPVEDEPDSETVLMALARNEALDRAADILGQAGGSIQAHVPNCIAIYNAYLAAGLVEEDAVVCLANIGHETMDIALVRGVDLLFARNLSGGGKVLDEAISSAFNVSGRKAETLKKDLLDLDPASRGKFGSNQAEKVTMAAGGSSNMLVSAIQSSLAFCKSQTKIADLRLDKILLAGGSARLRGIRGLLRQALRCPVEILDPFVAFDLTALDPEEMEGLDRMRTEAVVALGLAATVLDESLYSLEILPEAVKRRQRFYRRSIYNLAAVLVMLVLLGLGARSSADVVSKKESAERSLRRAARTAEMVHERAAKMVVKNKLQSQLAAMLAERTVAFDGLLHVMRALQDSLPPDLWIKSIAVKQASTAKDKRKPLIAVSGQGKEVSGDLRRVYDEFFRGLKQRSQLGQVNQVSYEPKGDRIEFEITFDFLPDPVEKKPNKRGN